MNLAFEEDYVNVETLERWCANFEIGNFIGNEPRGRPDRAVDDDVLRKIMENNPR
ncbi:hypothetical protein WH47_12178 [Habropoda laboriosa]|uniref:Histone-lysine N-methyltransferase SETMAR n=1 Tax=Habropoda laboriosa TaxID=597456 RepID=A0A0L7RAI7_9HYME|nr:hypothetical protein WH47_12178 [Habropoda laboriosa]